MFLEPEIHVNMQIPGETEICNKMRTLASELRFASVRLWWYGVETERGQQLFRSSLGEDAE